MKSRKFISLVIAIALLTALAAPCAALADGVAVSLRASSETVSPGGSVTVTVNVDVNATITGFQGLISYDGLSCSSNSFSGLSGLSCSSSDRAFLATSLGGGSTSSNGTATYVLSVPSSATVGSTYTVSVGGVEATIPGDTNPISASGRSITITVGGGSPVNPTTPPTSGPTAAPGTTPTPVPPTGNYAYAIAAALEKSTAKAGETVRVKVSFGVTAGTYRSFQCRFDYGKLTPGTPTATGLSPLSLGVSQTGFTATSMSGSATNATGYVMYPVTIPSDAKNGDTFTFKIYDIAGTTAGLNEQMKDGISVTIKVGTGSGGSGTGTETEEPLPTAIPVSAPVIRANMVGAMSGTSAGDIVSYQLKYTVVEGEAAGFSATLNYDTSLMSVVNVSAMDAPSDWTSTSDGATLTSFKMTNAEALKAGDVLTFNIMLKLNADTTSAALITLTNMTVTDVQWNQHPLADVNAVASTDKPIFSVMIDPVTEVEPGHYLDLEFDFTCTSGAFMGFQGAMEYDATKLTFVEASVPAGWQFLQSGDIIGVATSIGALYPGEILTLKARFMVSSETVKRGDTISFTYKDIAGQAIGGDAADRYSAETITLSLTASAATPAFTAKLYPVERRSLPTAQNAFTLELTSTTGSFAGFSVEYELSQYMTLINAVSDRGWSISSENGKLKLYTNGLNSIRKGETIKVTFQVNISAAAPYGEEIGFKTGDITGATHLSELATCAGVESKVLVQSAYINQKLKKYDFTSSLAVAPGAGSMSIGGASYPISLTYDDGSYADYTACVSNIGNKDVIVALDVRPVDGAFKPVNLTFAISKNGEARKAGVDFLAVVMDGASLMVNLGTFANDKNIEAFKALGGKMDSATLHLELAPVDESTCELAEIQMVGAQTAVTDGYRMRAYLTDGDVRQDLGDVAGGAYATLFAEDVYLLREVEKPSSVNVTSVTSALVATANTAKLLSKLVNNDYVRRSMVGVYCGEAIYLVTHK